VKILVSILLLSSACLAETTLPTPAAAPVQQNSNVTVTVNKSVILEHPVNIRRISISNPEIAEAVAVSSTEVLLNGKSAGDTTLILWDVKGDRASFDVHVLANTSKIDAVRGELQREVGPDVSLTVEGSSVFLRGTVSDPIAADRAENIAGTLGKVVNLLRVVVPASDPQIMLKVRFADVDRQASSQLGINIFGADASKGLGSSSTGQFGSHATLPTGNVGSGVAGLPLSLSNYLNIFFYRPDLNLGAAIQALEAKNLLQILAEPNLLTLSGRPASFLAGGEFPFPTLQGGGAGVGQITIQFKEFGIRLNFLPTVTPRGTIHLLVTPEVSSLDYANGLTVSGFTIPGLDTRRVQTEIELENGQSFVIAGLLDNRMTETLNKIPGLANIPVLGKLFESRSLSKSNTELLVMVTPELVRPIPAVAKRPDVSMPVPFLKDAPQNAPQNPGPDVTGAAPPLPTVNTLPVEEFKSPAQANGAGGNLPVPNGAGVPQQPAVPEQPPVNAQAGSGAHNR
jgi:pilus assembly protein CpaC